MKIDLQRKIDRILGQIICRLLSFIHYSGKEEKGTALLPPKRILVILLSEMGSLTLARPMLLYLKKKYPASQVFALVFERNREYLEILDLIPPQNIFSVDGENIWKMIWGSIYTIIEIRKAKVDTVLDCELFSRISSIYSYLSGARIRVGFHPHNQEGLYRGDFINRPVLYNPYLHISLQFQNLAKAIETDGFPLVKSKKDDNISNTPILDLAPKILGDMVNRIGKDFPEIEGKVLVLIYPGGGLLPIRAWPLSNFCKVCKDLVDKGYAVGIIGMEGDKKLLNAIRSFCGSKQCIDMTGYTKTVPELIALFHYAALLITNDGGPGHLASLTPISSIIFFGPETPILYAPLDDKSVNFYEPLSCSPCLTAYNHRNSPCDGNNACLKSIRTEEVLKKAYELLNHSDAGFTIF